MKIIAPARAGLVASLLCILGAARALSAPPAEAGHLLTAYVDPRQQTAIAFGAHSHWLQPWRAYLETVPARRLLDAIGINLNVTPEETDAACAHLAKNGFHTVRIEFGWGSVSWDDPTRFSDQERFDRVVLACKRHGLRPLFLLNGHHGGPCPMQTYDVRLTEPASKGDRTIHIDPATLTLAVKGRSGLSRLTDYKAAEVIFTEIGADGTVSLSKPLPKDLPAGAAPAATLKYPPFYPSVLKDKKTVPPEFEETMAGWLAYVRAVATNARRVLGTEGKADPGFDMEVWNELTFGSDFLSIGTYYEKPPAEGDSPTAEILRRTVAFVRDPANGFTGVGIGDGFNNQWPWGAGSTAPPGLAALDKHPYGGVRRFPQDQGPGGRSVDALGTLEGVSVGGDRWKDSYIPAYISDFPEYFLNALQTEHLIRDISPITTELYGVKHGRETHPLYPDGSPAPAPALWITEVNLDPSGADPGAEQDYVKGGQPPVAPGLTPADADRLKAKAILRYLTAYTNKGVARIYFFAAQDTNPLGLALIDPRFFKAVDGAKGAYPADDTGLTSPTMAAVRRLAQTMGLHASVTGPIHPVLLDKIEEPQPRMQFLGDPATAALSPNPHPALTNRDVLAFLPFQANPHRYVIPVYVMTRNMAHLYKPGAPGTDTTRFDMPAETFRLTVSGLDAFGAKPVGGLVVSLYDPLDGKSLPVSLVRREGGRATIEAQFTDSPRLLILESKSSGAAGATRK